MQFMSIIYKEFKMRRKIYVYLNLGLSINEKKKNPSKQNDTKHIIVTPH